jgi:hypothetical protein
MPHGVFNKEQIMDNSALNQKIIARGKELFSTVSGEKPSLFNKGAWMGKVMDWSMQNEQFKIQMFRFVDTFPSLTTGKMLTDHIREYFGEEKDMPPVLQSGARMAGMLGSLGGAVLNKVIADNIQEMGRQFIIGENTREAVKNIEKLRNEGFAAVVDVLGEATLTGEEEHQGIYRGRKTGGSPALFQPGPGRCGLLGTADDHRQHHPRAPHRPGGDLRTAAGGHARRGL